MITTADNQASMLLVDIIGSGTLYSEVDEEKAAARVQELKALLRETIEKYDGDIREQVGEEFMACFSTPRIALDAAHRMQALVAERATGNSGNQYLGIRIGLHHGPLDVNAPFDNSDTLWVAKRMVNHAENQQVLTTRSTRDMVLSVDRYKFKVRDNHDPQMHEADLTMQELLWEEITEHLPHVLIKAGDDEFKLTDEDEPQLIGRSEDCDITIALPGVSRAHLKVAYRYGWLELFDQSTNGTLIFPEGGKELLLKQRKARIRGQGKLLFTPKGHPGDEASITYEVLND